LNDQLTKRLNEQLTERLDERLNDQLTKRLNEQLTERLKTLDERLTDRLDERLKTYECDALGSCTYKEINSNEINSQLINCSHLLIDDNELQFDNLSFVHKNKDTQNTISTSQTFQSDVKIHFGDVVGIQNDNTGHINRVIGCMFYDEESSDINNDKQLLFYNNDLKMYAEIADSALYLTVENTSSFDKLQLNPSFSNGNKNILIIKLINSYIIAFYINNQIVLQKFSINNTPDKITIINQSKLSYECGDISTFDLVYESTNNLDILILVMYCECNNNINITLFSTIDNLSVGYNKKNISDIPIVGIDKSLKTLLIPGQIVICSYDQYKTFILLSSNASEEFSLGVSYMSPDSIDCADMIYDEKNSIIMSIERTLINSVYIQISDIYGTYLNPISKKIIGRHIVVPLKIRYNYITDNYVLFYVNQNNQICAQLFTFDGETITLGLIYTRKNTNYSFDKLNFERLLHNQLYYLKENELSIEWTSSNKICKCKFDDNFGVQATAYLGLAMHISDNIEVALRGQIFYCQSLCLPVHFVGKRLYLNNAKIQELFPNNLTLIPTGNVFIGTCLSTKTILVGL